jgi:hypothetical protein
VVDAASLSARWSVLLGEAARAGGALAYLDHGSDRIRLGADVEGNRYLLVLAEAGASLDEDVRGRVVQLRRVGLGQSQYLAAVCVDVAFAEVFVQLCAELIDTLAGAPTPANELRVQLDRWRRLFSTDRDRLSPQALSGLYGELSQLRALVIENGGTAFDSWIGPTGAVHDFRVGDCAIEVKTSTTRVGRRVSISSVEQLASPSGVDLYLSFLGLRLDPAGESVPQLLEALVDLGIPRIDLLERVAPIGYHPEHSAGYEEQRFLVHEWLLYDVSSPAFPRITEQSFVGSKVPPGVASVSYVIDLTNSPPVPLSDPEVLGVHSRFEVRA